MDNKQSKYIAVSYQLFSIEKKGEKHLEEQTEQGRPFRFITGFGFTHDAFEHQIEALEPSTKFDFSLKPEEAFGEYYEEGVHKMPREEFFVNGRFDDSRIYPGAIITLFGEDDKRLMARVTKIEEDGVTLDANHPLAGKTLQFTGVVLENRLATAEEIQDLLNHLGHDCSGCDGNCDSDECEGGCGHCCH